MTDRTAPFWPVFALAADLRLIDELRLQHALDIALVDVTAPPATPFLCVDPVSAPPPVPKLVMPSIPVEPLARNRHERRAHAARYRRRIK